MISLWRWGGGVILLAGVAALVWFAARDARPPALPTDTLTVAASIFPVADIARQVGGDAVTVVTVIPPGVSEHVESVTPQTIQSLQSARVIFQIGHGLEDQLVQRLTRSLPDLSVATVDKGITLREFTAEEHEGEATDEHQNDTGIDPHYWLTVPNGIRIATTIAEELKKIDPANTTFYDANLARYVTTLQELDQGLRTAAAQASPKEFIAMHNAWSYLADEYGLQLVATYEPTEGHQPSAADLQQLREVIDRYKITAFYAEPQKASSSVARFMRQEFGVETRVLDPVGGGAETASYVDLMRFNIAALAGTK